MYTKNQQVKVNYPAYNFQKKEYEPIEVNAIYLGQVTIKSFAVICDLHEIFPLQFIFPNPKTLLIESKDFINL